MFWLVSCLFNKTGTLRKTEITILSVLSLWTFTLRSEQYFGSGWEIQIVRFVGYLTRPFKFSTATTFSNGGCYWCESANHLLPLANSQAQVRLFSLWSHSADFIWLQFLRSNCNNRLNRVYISFDDETVRILESILASKGVKSLIGVRSALKQFMRSESLSIVREIAEEPVERKLICADFLIRVFALIGDAEVIGQSIWHFFAEFFLSNLIMQQLLWWKLKLIHWIVNKNMYTCMAYSFSLLWIHTVAILDNTNVFHTTIACNEVQPLLTLSDAESLFKLGVFFSSIIFHTLYFCGAKDLYKDCTLSNNWVNVHTYRAIGIH